jgi:ferritin-like metal-binding protein YciE
MAASSCGASLSEMKLDTLLSLYTAEIQELLSAERVLAKALEKVAVAASDGELCQALVSHAAETLRHAERLTSILEDLGRPTTRLPKCAGIAGIVAEADAVLGTEGDPHVRDLAFVGVVRRAEHYEIVSYNLAIACARSLGRNADILLLEATLDEERKADDWLSRIAISSLRPA